MPNQHARRLPLTPSHICLSLLALLLAGLLTAAPARAQGPTPIEPPSVSGGQALWAENCLPCHGPTGQGDGPTAASLPNPPADLTDPARAQQHLPAEIFTIIKEGRMDKMMPPWKTKLTDAQIWDAVAYVWSLGTPPQTLAAGQTVYTQQCAACHGESGRGDGPQAVPPLNDFTNLAVMAGLSQADLLTRYQTGKTHADLTSLSQTDLQSALAYARTFSLAMPERHGTLSGQVTNSATARPVGGITVTLHAIQDNARLETRTTQADQSGHYRFDNLLTEHTIIYVVEGVYQGVAYFSQEPGMFLPDSTETTLNLTVSETTTSNEAIDVTQLHYLVSFSRGAANIMQIFIVGNKGDKTYIGQNGQTFPFALPQNATNVTFQNDPNGNRFVKTATGYSDTEPVMPGPEGLTILAMYDVPFTGDTLDINLPLPARVRTVNALLTDQGANLTSPQLQFVENRDFQGNAFAVFAGQELPPEQPLSLSLTGLNNLAFTPETVPGAANPHAAAATGFNQQGAMWAILGLGGLAVILAAVVYPLRRAGWPSGEESPADRRQKLLLLLARLDENYEAGDIDPAIYRRARAKTKAELADLLERV
jgi:mono/diheme cytochrome c family protein/5-hydroxyisourate hydrolase-like protein (transthyretin family)